MLLTHKAGQMEVGAAGPPSRGGRGLSETQSLHSTVGSLGSPGRASVWCELAAVLAGAEHGSVASANNSYILIFFGFESFKPTFKC